MKIIVTGTGLIAPTTDFDIKQYLSTPKTYLDRASALALAGCALALSDAGLEGPFDSDFGIALGTQFGCVETMRVFEATLAEKGARSVSPLLFSHSYFNSPISLCAIEWGLKGWHGTFCGADALATAVEAAHDAILLGHSTRMLCGGVDALSTARSWAEEIEPREWSAFWVLEREGEGREGRAFTDVFATGWSVESMLATS
jgi:3-oxoacyl-(acyl-carrier-protein) synthase